MEEEPHKTHSELIGEGRTVAPGRSTLTSHRPELVAGNLPRGFCLAPRKHPLENRLLQCQASSPKGATLGLLQASDSPPWGQEEKGQQGREPISPAVPYSAPCSTELPKAHSIGLHGTEVGRVTKQGKCEVGLEPRGNKLIMDTVHTFDYSASM